MSICYLLLICTIVAVWQLSAVMACTKTTPRTTSTTTSMPTTPKTPTTTPEALALANCNSEVLIKDYLDDTDMKPALSAIPETLFVEVLVVVECG